MKTKGKFLIILTVIFSFCIVALFISACKKENDGELKYTLSGGEQTLTTFIPPFYGKCTEVIIPEEVDGYPVTAIGDGVFAWCSDVERITIPNSVKSIGNGAFRDCSAQIIWGDNPQITEIGNGAFWDYKGTSITIPDNVISIGSGAFSGCENITSITIPNGVAYIGSSAFSDCSNIESITISDGVTSIEDYVFSDCTSLKSVSIPDSVTSIGESAFSNCTILTSIVIPNSVTYIGKKAFNHCKAEIVWGNSPHINVIGEDVFYGYAGTSITVPISVTTIADSAFTGSSNLVSIEIPASVTSIGNYIFDGCSSLESINVSSGNTVYHSSGNCLIKTIDKTIIAGSISSVIPNDGSVTSIGDYAFYNNSGLTNITIPGNVKYIGFGAFYGCSGLTSAVFENTDGWKVTDRYSRTLILSDGVLEDVATAATYLNSKYINFEWRCN